MTIGKSILVVDDEAFFRTVLRQMLEKNGYTVLEASDGDGAVSVYRETNPDIVLMDIYMPQKNGIEATREIVAIDQSAIILVCSGSGYDDDINAALAVGAKGVISKPFYDEEVLSVVNSHI